MTKLLFPPTDEWCLPAPSAIKPEEREFVVDSGGSMHMLTKKDLNSAELETGRVSKSPCNQLRSAIQRRNDSVCQTIGFIRDCKTSQKYSHSEDSAKITDIPTSGAIVRNHNWQTNFMQHGELRTDHCPWFIDRLFMLSYTYISNIFTAGSSNYYIRFFFERRVN